MGQRHQIYVKIAYPATITSYEVSYESSLIPLHNQWFYGISPAAFAINLLLLAQDAATKPLEENIFLFDSPKNRETVASFIESNYTKTLFGGEELSTNSHLEDKTASFYPSGGDNNDGITILDLSTPEPKYAFMFLATSDVNGPPFEPMNADEYIAHYYDESLLFKNPYWKHNKEELMHYINMRKRISPLFNTFTELNLQDLLNIFPKDHSIKLFYLDKKTLSEEELNRYINWWNSLSTITIEVAQELCPKNESFDDTQLTSFYSYNARFLKEGNVLISDEVLISYFKNNIDVFNALRITVYKTKDERLILSEIPNTNQAYKLNFESPFRALFVLLSHEDMI